MKSYIVIVKNAGHKTSSHSLYKEIKILKNKYSIDTRGYFER